MAGENDNQQTDVCITADATFGTKSNNHSPGRTPKDKTASPAVSLSAKKDSREAALELKWTSCIPSNAKYLPLHKNVAVLLISWNKNCDDLHVEKEVRT